MYHENLSSELGNDEKLCSCKLNRSKQVKHKEEPIVSTILLYLQAYFILLVTTSKYLHETNDVMSQTPGLQEPHVIQDKTP